MKRLILLFCLFGITATKAQYVTLTDTNFTNRLKVLYPTCFNGKQLDTTCSDIVNETYLNFYGEQNKPIKSVDGLQYFKKLMYLTLVSVQAPILPPLANTIIDLDIGHNYFTSLPAHLPDSMVEFSCNSNFIDSIPPLPAKLTVLNADGNRFKHLPPLPPNLKNLGCGHSHLREIVSLPDKLEVFSCLFDSLKKLPALPASLKILNFGNNPGITELKGPLPAGLTQLWAFSTNVSVLPPIPATVTLLNLGNMRISSIPNLPDSLTDFDVYGNPLLTCLPEYKIIDDFSFIGSGLKCLPSYAGIKSSSPDIKTLPLCDMFNPNGCAVYWNISGSVYLDANKDCIHQPDEDLIYPVKMKLYQNGNLIQQNIFPGDYTFNTGYGTYTVEIDTTGLPFKVRCPAGLTQTVTVTAQDSLIYHADFALECSDAFDIGVSSIAGRMRTNDYNTIKIIAGDASGYYHTGCADGVAGTVTATISGPAKYIGAVNGSLTPVPSNGNTVVTWTVDDFGDVSSTDAFIIYVQTTSGASLDDEVCITVSVTPTAGDNRPGNNALKQCFKVTGPFDPNIKEAYPIGNTDTATKWLTYTIHFQNTGTDTARDIHIMDTLDSHLNVATFTLLNTSHKATTLVTEQGLITFNFPGIYLPDSNTNEPRSHGYVQYKIKLKDNLTIGTQVLNSAAIYFESNPPVITNTTVNTIVANTATGLPATEITGVEIYPNPATNQLYLTAAGFIPQLINVYDLTGKKFIEAKYTPQLNISTLATGVYIIEVKDNNNLVRSRFVKL